MSAARSIVEWILKELNPFFNMDYKNRFMIFKTIVG